MKNKLKKIYYKIFGKISSKKLKYKNFTIISNNCFGGIFYRNNSLEYLSPTCGMYFIASDYIKFIKNLDYYLSIDKIEKIDIKNSNNKDYLMLTDYNGLIGKLDDIEIMLLHYNSIEEANKKWTRRKKRINKKFIIYKFSDQNNCTYKDLIEFNDFPSKNKICFTSKKYKNIETTQIKKYENYSYVLSDVNPKDYKKYFNMYDFINECGDKLNEK